MKVSGTIVRGISTRPGTTWDGRSAAPDPRAEPKRREPPPRVGEEEPPLEPGTGAVVDRKV
jgi:hypothetical protein